jgi:hypothetical protein
MEFASFHVGPSLAPHLQASLRSWVDYGHCIDLYTYDPDLIVPPGVQRRDATEILPSSAIFTHGKGVGKGTIAAFSDLFRFTLCQKREVTWVDTDELCLRSDWPERDYDFAWQSDEQLECNIAVFRAPRDSELLRAVLDEISRVDRAEAHFGQMGPVPFTRALKSLHLEHLALPAGTYYPIDYLECRIFLDPDLRSLAEERMRDAYAVHLWNEAWTRMRFPSFLRPPRGSWLESIYERHGVDFVLDAYIDDLDALTMVPAVPTVPLSQYEEVSAWAKSLEDELIALKEHQSSERGELTSQSGSTLRRMIGRLRS